MLICALKINSAPSKRQPWYAHAKVPSASIRPSLNATLWCGHALSNTRHPPSLSLHTTTSLPRICIGHGLFSGSDATGCTAYLQKNRTFFGSLPRKLGKTFPNCSIYGSRPVIPYWLKCKIVVVVKFLGSTRCNSQACEYLAVFSIQSQSGERSSSSTEQHGKKRGRNHFRVGRGPRFVCLFCFVLFCFFFVFSSSSALTLPPVNQSSTIRAKAATKEVAHQRCLQSITSPSASLLPSDLALVFAATRSDPGVSTGGVESVSTGGAAAVSAGGVGVSTGVASDFTSDRKSFLSKCLDEMKPLLCGVVVQGERAYDCSFAFA